MRINCTICGRTQTDVSLLIKGKNDCSICNECILYYNDLLQQYSTIPSKQEKHHKLFANPTEIKKELDRKMVGQETAKKILSLAVYDQMIKIRNPEKKVITNNVLLVGPTGVGKTYIMRLLSEIVDIPMIICDANMYSEVGYVGADVNRMIFDLFEKAGRDVTKTENGIIFIDEIDKTARKGDFHTNNRDVSGEGVQQALLKIIEGCTIEVGSGRNAVQINTDSIMFVMGGAFVGLDYSGDSTRELVNYGLLPELVGRIQMIANMDELSKADLIRVIRDVDGSLIERQQSIFKLSKMSLRIEDDALEYIASYACQRGLGARGMISAVTNALNLIRYEAFENNETECILTKKRAESHIS